MNEIREIVTKAIVGKGKKDYSYQRFRYPEERGFQHIGLLDYKSRIRSDINR